ncbi:ArsR/SmtB family transcription factor [Acidocella aminolytica]|jgi:ArsR family transcriptional regulator
MTLIAEALGVAQPTASRHLDILRQAQFIVVRRYLKWSY